MTKHWKVFILSTDTFEDVRIHFSVIAQSKKDAEKIAKVFLLYMPSEITKLLRPETLQTINFNILKIKFYLDTFYVNDDDGNEFEMNEAIPWETYKPLHDLVFTESHFYDAPLPSSPKPMVLAAEEF